MKINFKNVKIEGFLSIGSMEIDLSNKNIVLVEGKNDSGKGLASNGSGKSCIFESIYWVLTGKTIRGTREVINRYYKGYTSVKLLLEVNDDEFVLLRFREHPKHGNNLIIYKNGEEISGSGVKKSEQILNNELPFLSEDLIGSVIILGQGLPAKFTNYDPAGRKEILEVLSGNLGIIDGIKDILSNYRGHVTKQISDKNLEVGKLETAIELRRKDVEEMKSKQGQNKENIEDLKAKLLELETEKNSLKDKIKNGQEKLSKIQSAISEATVEKSSLEQKSRNATANIKSFKDKLLTLKSENCPTCGQALLDESFIQKTRIEFKDLLEKESDIKTGAEGELVRINSNLDLFNEKYTNLSNIINDKKGLTNSLEYDIIEVQGKLTQSNDYTEKIREYEKEIVENDSSLHDVVLELGVFEREEEILGHALREVGRDFRGFLLSGVIDYLNNILKEIAIELYGKEDLKLVLEDNKVEIEFEGRSYSSLSGGEQRRADLAMQFALRSLLVNSLGFSSNILVVDEILDGLDGVGIDSLIRFITSGLGDIESIFIITHNSALPIPYDEKITVVKGKNMISNLGS